MRKIFKHLKPFDYIFIILAVLLSFVPTIITYARYQEVDQNMGVVKIYGETVDTFELYEGRENELKVYYPANGQYNIIEVDGERMRIKEDNSPDQIGVNTGWIQNPGQTAICLPHGLIIEIVGEKADDDLVLPL